MKKFLSLVLSCAMGFSTVFAVGCDKEDNSSTPPVQIAEKLELSNQNLMLTLGEKAELSAAYNEIAGETLAWSSSALNVVSVDENGFVEALSVGVATITARYGSKQATCSVEVGLSGYVPVLAFASNIGDTVSIMKGATLDLGAKVSFNGKNYPDGQIEYYVSDESVGTVESGKFVAKDKAGSVTVSVFATWRGQTVRAASITVNVIPEHSVLLNGGMLTAVELYMAAEHEGKQYTTSQTIESVYVSKDGTEIKDYTLSVLDEGIAGLERSGDEWTLLPKKAGKTSLIVSYDGHEFPFDVLVSRPVAELTGTINYSLSDDQYFDGEKECLQDVSKAVDGFGTLVSYVLDGKEYKAKDGKLSLSEGKGQIVTLYNDTVGYRAVFDVYTMIVDELQDFEKIYAGDETTEIDGLYMLGRDIIEPDTVLSMPAGKVPNNFAGEFDGKGHVLTFTFEHSMAYRHGLFGEFLCGATIKNLALNNIKKNGTSGAHPAGIICGEGATSAQSPLFSTIENVYVNVEFTQSGQSNLAFMGNVIWRTNVKNVIIDVPTVPECDTYGSFARGASASVSNSYVISSAPIYKTVDGSTFEVVPPLYADYAALMAAGKDYSSFSAEYWDTTTYGVPVWKSLVNDFSV